MKIAKRLAILLFALILAFAAIACGGTEENSPAPKAINHAETAQALIDGCTFEEKPEIIESEFGLTQLFEIDGNLIAKDENGNYMGTAAICSSTPETVIVIKAVDNASAEKIRHEYLAKRVEAYIHDYANYGPEQVAKLNDCMNRVDGEYVFLIISADNAAALNLLNELTK